MMKTTKKQLIIAISSLLILVIALTFCILDFTGIVKFWQWAWHPILTFLLFAFVGFGFICMILGILNKSPWFYFLTSVLLSMALFGILFHYIPWWICLIAVIVLCSITALFSFITAGNKTENIALNDKPEYKNYKERREEKLKAEAENEKEELPEIKSFK